MTHACLTRLAPVLANEDSQNALCVARAARAQLCLALLPVTGQQVAASFSFADSASMHADEMHYYALPAHSLFYGAAAVSYFPCKPTHRVELSHVTAAVCPVSVSFLGLRR